MLLDYLPLLDKLILKKLHLVKNYEDCQNGIAIASADMKAAATNFKDAMRGTQDELAAAAKELTRASAELATYTKATGALGADKNAQSAIIEACIKCESEWSSYTY